MEYVISALVLTIYLYMAFQIQQIRKNSADQVQATRQLLRYIQEKDAAEFQAGKR